MSKRKSQSKSAADKAVPAAKAAPIGDTPEGGAQMAKALLAPEIAAYRVIRGAENGIQVDTPHILKALGRQQRSATKAVIAGDLSKVEAMLFNQATGLQALFSCLCEKGLRADTLALFEGFLRVALRAQSQCTRTLEVLAAMKNPPLVIARQANVTTGPQQNNFGAPARGESEIKPTELLEQIDGERLDTGTTAQAVGSDPALATVDAQHRP